MEDDDSTIVQTLGRLEIPKEHHRATSLQFNTVAIDSVASSLEIIVKALSLKNLSPFYIILEDTPLFTDLFVGTMHDIRR